METNRKVGRKRIGPIRNNSAGGHRCNVATNLVRNNRSRAPSNREPSKSRNNALSNHGNNNSHSNNRRSHSAPINHASSNNNKRSNAPINHANRTKRSRDSSPVFNNPSVHNSGNNNATNNNDSNMARSSHAGPNRREPGSSKEDGRSRAVGKVMIPGSRTARSTGRRIIAHGPSAADTEVTTFRRTASAFISAASTPSASKAGRLCIWDILASPTAASHS